MAKYFLISLFIITQTVKSQCPVIQCLSDTIIFYPLAEKCVTVNYQLPEVMDLCYDTGKITYSHTGKTRYFTVPEGVKELNVTIFSASGNTIKRTTMSYVTCNLRVYSGQKIILFVGGSATFSYPYSYISLIDDFTNVNQKVYKKALQNKKVTNKKLMSSLTGEQGTFYLTTDQDLMINETSLVNSLKFHPTEYKGDGKIIISWNNQPILKRTLFSGLGSGACFPLGINKETYVVESSSGKNDTCSFYVNVFSEDEAINKDFIYPNPTNGVFTVDLKNNDKTIINYSISTIEGVRVKSGTTIENKIIVDLTNETKGVYFLEINRNNKKATYKVIKQ